MQKGTVLRDASATSFRSSELNTGQIIGDFLILKKLGQGGIASVYLARQQSLEREVALKVSDSQSEEGKTLARLDHPNIVRVYSDGTDPETGLRICSVQVVDGPSLDKVGAAIPEDVKTSPLGFTGDDWLKLLNPGNPTQSSLSNLSALETVLHLGVVLARALAHAHEKGVLHLDIKPANILIDKAGKPYLADFNVSNLQDVLSSGLPSTFGGTPAYMSPEQKLAVEAPCPRHFQLLSTRSDVFSLARVLQRLAESTLPLSLLQIEKTGEGPKNAAEAPVVQFWNILSRALEKDSAKRTASAALMAEELEDCLELSRVLRTYPASGAQKEFRKGMNELLFLLLAPILAGTAYFYFLWFKDYNLGFTYRPITYIAAKGGLFAVIAFSIGIFFLFRKRLGECVRQREVDPMAVEKLRVSVFRLPFIFAWLNVWCWASAFHLSDPKYLAGRLSAAHILPVCTYLVIFILVASWNFGRLLQWTVGFAYPWLWRGMSHPSERAQKDLSRLRKSANRYRYLSIYFPLFVVAASTIRIQQNYDVVWQAVFTIRTQELLVLIAYQVIASARPLALIDQALRASSEGRRA